MRFRYTKWTPDPEASRRRFNKLLKLFNQLLLMTNGDVDEAVEWLKQLNDRYNMFRSEEELERFIQAMKQQGLIGEGEGGSLVITQKGNQRIRQDSFEELFSGLKKTGSGSHQTPFAGEGIERMSETRAFQFGDSPAGWGCLVRQR